MRKFIKGLSLLFVLFSATTLAAQENVVDEVVWVVGDEAILRSQVEEQRLRMQYMGEKIDGDPYCVIPEQLAIQKLFLHQAKLDSIDVTDADVFREVEAQANYYISHFGSKEKVEEYWGKNMSELRDEWREQLRDQNTVRKMQAKLVEKVKVTPAEVRRYFQSLPEDSIPFIPAQLEVEVITFEPKIPQEEIDNIKARLRDYTNRVVNGESEFSTLAILYSEDPGSARNGGELDFMGRGQLDPAFAAAAFQLNDTKKVSKIVQSEYGYHIIQLVEKRSDRAKFRHILISPKVSEKELKETMVRMDSLKTDLDSLKFSFEEAAMYLSHDKDTRNNNGLMVNRRNGTSKFQLEDLPVEVARQVENMKVNDISAPFVMRSQAHNRDVVALVKLKSRLEGHKATIYDDYQALKAMLEDKKREEVITDFIKKKQKETYIRIKEGWRNCDFEYPGWVKN